MATDVPCPAPESPDDYAPRKAPKEIYSVDHPATDGGSEYSIRIDLNYGDFSLDAVVLHHVSGDKTLLLTSIEPLRLETEAVFNIVVDPSISEDVRLFFAYTERDGICPETISFEYRFTEISAD